MTTKKWSSEYEEFVGDVADNVEEILDRYGELPLHQVSKKYASRYDDELVSAFDTAGEQFSKAYKKSRGMPSQVVTSTSAGVSLRQGHDSRPHASLGFFSHICEALDRLEEDGKVERDQGIVKYNGAR